MSKFRREPTSLSDRHALEKERRFVWTSDIAPLFNDVGFRARPTHFLSCGVTQESIIEIYAVLKQSQRRAQKLKDQLGILKSRFKISIDSYTRSGQGNPYTFPHFSQSRAWVMHSFCFVKSFPFVCDISVRSLPEIS